MSNSSFAAAVLSIQRMTTAMLTRLGGKLDVTGTATAARRLSTARKIQGVDFDGTGDIDLGLKSMGKRNVFISTASPTSADGADGDIWLTYLP